MANATWLVAREPYYAGWTWTHEVMLAYRERTFVPGLLVSLVTVGLLAWTVRRRAGAARLVAADRDQNCASS